MSALLVYDAADGRATDSLTVDTTRRGDERWTCVWVNAVENCPEHSWMASRRNPIVRRTWLESVLGRKQTLQAARHRDASGRRPQRVPPCGGVADSRTYSLAPDAP